MRQPPGKTPRYVAPAVPAMIVGSSTMRSLVTEAPTLPAPKTPSAKPCRSLREPGGVPRDADAEQVAGEPDEEGEDEQRQVARDLGDEEAGDRREQQHGHGDDPAADPVGEHAGRESPQRPVEHRHRGDPRELRVGEAELLLDRHAQDAEHQPDREHQREGDGRHRQHALGPAADVRARTPSAGVASRASGPVASWVIGSSICLNCSSKSRRRDRTPTRGWLTRKVRLTYYDAQ